MKRLFLIAIALVIPIFFILVLLSSRHHRRKTLNRESARQRDDASASE